MPLERISPGSPADWLRFAEADLRLATADIPDVMRSLYCFHAQQAAEKAIKAVLTRAGIDVQRTHDLRNLLDRLPPAFRAPPEVEDSAALTKYSVQLRYPGEEEDVSEQERAEAVRLAKLVCKWATLTVSRSAGSGAT
jgi:HEPN domain-containing protein